MRHVVRAHYATEREVLDAIRALGPATLLLPPGYEVQIIGPQTVEDRFDYWMWRCECTQVAALEITRRLRAGRGLSRAELAARRPGVIPCP